MGMDCKDNVEGMTEHSKCKKCGKEFYCWHVGDTVRVKSGVEAPGLEVDTKTGRLGPGDDVDVSGHSGQVMDTRRYGDYNDVTVRLDAETLRKLTLANCILTEDDEEEWDRITVQD
jgi:hypothetical protein